MMAQALDPHHSGIAETIAMIEQGGEVSLEQAGFAPEGAPAATASEAPVDDSEAPPAGLEAPANDSGAPAFDSDQAAATFEPAAESSELFSAPAEDVAAPTAEELGDVVSAPPSEPTVEMSQGPPPTHVSVPPADEPERSVT